MTKRIYILSLLTVMLGLAFSFNIALAQDTATTTSEVVIDVTADDLGISEPTVLPDSPWYGLKKFWEGLRDTFTFNPIVKAENSLTRASERLIEMQKLVDAGKIENADQVILNYEKHIDKIKERIDKLNDIHSDKAEKFLDKFAEYQIKHRLILEKIEESSLTPEDIAAAKEKALTILGEVLAKTDNEKLQARLEMAIEKIEDGDLKQFKNLEVLKALEDKVPEQAKPAILRAEANALKRLKSDIDELPEGMRSERIQKTLEQNRGDEEHYMEILDELNANDGLPPQVMRELPAIKMKLEERMRNREGSDDNENEVEESGDDDSESNDDSSNDQ